MKSPTAIPLRQRKQAQTRLALVRAALARLHDGRTLDDVNVKDLCRDVSISEASFFNYFHKKSDLLVFYVQLWSLDLGWRLRHELSGGTARDAIAAIFASTAREVAAQPEVMAEIIAYQARHTEPPVAADVPLPDRLAAYPERPGIEAIPGLGLDGLLPPLIARAVAEGDLPGDVDQAGAFLALTAIFFGVPLVLRRSPRAGLEAHYQRQLDIVWQGLQHAPSRRSGTPHSRVAGRRRR
jgi:AcrR family transcriptional regulator